MVSMGTRVTRAPRVLLGSMESMGSVDLRANPALRVVVERTAVPAHKANRVRTALLARMARRELPAMLEVRESKAIRERPGPKDRRALTGLPVRRARRD
jgi:hypothetical protein